MIKFDFHVSKQARIKYGLDASLFSVTGNLIIADFKQARILSDKINNKRKAEGVENRFVTAGEINAAGLLHEIFHFLIRNYETNQNPGVFSKAIDTLKSEISEKGFYETMLAFINEFPPSKIFNGELTGEEFLKNKTENKPNAEIILEEIILLHFENLNPALFNLKELFDDELLKKLDSYKKVISLTEKFFDAEVPVSKGGLSLFNVLKRPIVQNPYDILKQLDFIKDEWGMLIDENFRIRLLRSADLFNEDYKLFVKHGGGEKTTPPVPDYREEFLRLKEVREKKEKGIKLSDYEKSFYLEYEKFTEDTGWIPEIVMIAKNVFVWMHQLSEKYQRKINTLDQIPDEELDILAQCNFTALWLIGIWERSPASKKIKHLTGNISAVASAYSLYDYVIAKELGGESAFQNLKDRAWLRGIRLASDMVPNHTGIYSKWVIEKPDYFIQRNDPPFPGYTFNSPNLSDDQRVDIRIEDKYYNRTDAAVVFQRRDKYTGDVKYIYHGNDGTNMPWNDTAQLNLLNPEVRESLIQTIMHVAHKTPIIRFDAAMTLSKKHYQRLWYPQPGSGGAIPSRSDFAMTIEQFNSAMPQEFWREVVDRINESMPNVLLMAEAFWLMESYFVRTLGMHRVYNSAFMHMMMKEENAKYRQLIINTLEFNPEILKRYVNFMSNPDEETAVNQFGKGDKYFGVAVMMVTMPGLPMFGHGQLEGFSEKYGMEYKRAYYNEFPDEHLIWRHQKEIFPLMKLRYIFSQVYNFEFYDFIKPDGSIDQNVFAFSNRSGNDIALVLYNNCYDPTEGEINYSVFRSSAGNGKSVNPPKKLGELININPDKKFFYSYTDHRTGLVYLLSGNSIHENGFKIRLFGYQYRICLNFKEHYDTTGELTNLYNQLNGTGVSSIQEALREIKLLPIHNNLDQLFSEDNLNQLVKYLTAKTPGKRQYVKSLPDKKLIADFVSVCEEVNNFTTDDFPVDEAVNKFINSLITIRNYFNVWIKYSNRKKVPVWMRNLNEVLPLNGKIELNAEMAILFMLVSLKQIIIYKNRDKILVDEFNELMLSNPVNKLLEKYISNHSIHEKSQLVPALIHIAFYQKINQKRNSLSNQSLLFLSDEEVTDMSKSLLNLLLKDNFIMNFLRVNKFEDTVYFNKERFDEIINWVALLTSFELNFIAINDDDFGWKRKTLREKENLLFSRIRSNSGWLINLKKFAVEIDFNFNKLLKKLDTKGEEKDSNNKEEVIE